MKFGGTKVQNDSYTVTHFIAEYFDFKIEALIKKYACNILYPTWILDSI